ncbi:hypothetical protein [Streptomyces chartreusis]
MVDALRSASGEFAALEAAPADGPRRTVVRRGSHLPCCHTLRPRSVSAV